MSEKKINNKEEILASLKRKRESLEEDLLNINDRIKANEFPQAADDPDFSEMQSLCYQYLTSLQDGERFKDPEVYVFEEAMKAIYGNKVFDWVGEQEDNE